MPQILAIALGGAAGAITRFLIANVIYGLVGRSFPIGTLFINVSGSFLMGFLTELFLQRFAFAVEVRAAILIGFLGAYTTFSTFALETLYLFETGSAIKAFLNMFLSVVFCVAACWLGLIFARTLWSDNPSPGLMPLPHYTQLLAILIVTLLISILAEIFIKSFSLNNEQRAIIFIVLLGLSCLATSLSFACRFTEIGLEFHGLLSIFVINALLSVCVIWTGSLLGNWLWQLKLSQ